MSEDRAITVISERPPLASRALAGGILGASLGLFIFTATISPYGFAVPLLLITAIPAVGLGGVVALAAYIIQQRRGSLSRLNQDLIHLNSLMERRLINEDDYQMLKRRVLDDYQPQRMNIHNILKPAWWAGLVASLIPLIIIPLSIISTSPWMAPIQGFIASMLLPGVGGAALGVVGTNIIHRLQAGRRHPKLPSGELTEWQALGTRQPLPLPKK